MGSITTFLHETIAEIDRESLQLEEYENAGSRKRMTGSSNRPQRVKIRASHIP